MISPLVAPFAPVSVAPFQVGDLVVNFGVRPRGSLRPVRQRRPAPARDVAARPTPAGFEQAQWRADAAKCRPAL
jgi:hypothetical protein